MKTIKIYQEALKYVAWVRNGSEHRTFELRYTPKLYSPDKVRAVLQAENPRALVMLHI